ncbi:hypothetical protein QWZ13_12160 [Reinekea marina]|nr:hypothetical protein [Reinekea marina]MDN3649668.1 hypothetical protein [Reinekea marina]
MVPFPLHIIIAVTVMEVKRQLLMGLQPIRTMKMDHCVTSTT